jgi:hypothetical protein
VPAQLLLEPAELALDLRRQREAFARLVQDRVDPAPCRPVNPSFDVSRVSRVGRLEQVLEHGCLESITDRWTRVGIEAAGEVGAEDRREPLIGLDGWPGRARFDPVQEPPIDAGRRGQARSAHPGILAQAQEILGEVVVASSGRAPDGGVELT